MFLLATLFASLAISVNAFADGVRTCDIPWPTEVGTKADFMNANYMGVKAEAFTVTLSKDMNKDKLMLTAVGTDGNILGFVASAKEAGTATVGGTFSGDSGKQPEGAMCGPGWYTHNARVNAATTSIMFEPADTTKSYDIEVHALIGATGTGIERSFFMQKVTVGPPGAGGNTTPAGTTADGTTADGTTAAGTTAAPGTTGPGGSTAAPGTTGDDAAPAAEPGACTKCVGEGKTWCVVGLTREQDTGSCKDSADDCNVAATGITDAKMCIKDLNDECEALTKDMDDNLAECKACVAKAGCGACSSAGAAAGVIGVGDRLAGLSCSYIGEDGEDGCVNPLLTPIKTEAECDSASAVLLSGLAAVVALVSQF